MSQDWPPYPHCLEATDLLSLDLHVLQSSSRQGTEALTGSLLQSRCTELLAKPRMQSLAGGCSRGAQCTWCTPAHVFWSTRPRSGRPEFWLLDAVHGEEVEKVGCRVSAGCGEEGTWTQSCHLLATRLQAKLWWESSLKLCHCGEGMHNSQGTEIAHKKGAWLSSLSQVPPWEAPFQLLPNTKSTGGFEVKNPSLELCCWRGIFAQN